MKIKYYTQHIKEYDNLEFDRLANEVDFFKCLDEFILKNSNDPEALKIPVLKRDIATHSTITQSYNKFTK